MSDESQGTHGTGTITIKKTDLWKYSTFLLLAMLVIGGIFVFVGRNDTTGSVTGGSVNNPSPNIPTQPSIVKASEDDDPSKGSENAPVTIIEFSDFECPFCSRFYTQTLPSLEENYIKTGKVKLVYRDFPLTQIHSQAQKAAEAAECADEQGKFWEYHNKIFENQNAIDVLSLKQYAKDLKLDSGKFDSCLDSGKMASEVQKDLAEGSSYGVQGTPSFFINGISLEGAYPYSEFEKIIEQELAK